MKPTKNRYFCKDCNRKKMLFESEKKANTFIKFNSEEIEEEAGYSPERSYFCTYCGGWHVTSQKEILAVKSRTEKILELYELEKEKKLQIKAKNKLILAKKQEELCNKLDNIEKYINMLESIHENNEIFPTMLTKAINDFEVSKKIRVSFKGSGKKRRELEQKLDTLKEKKL